MATVFSVVGQPVTRADGPDKVTGQSQYASDIAMIVFDVVFGVVWQPVLEAEIYT